MAKLTKRHTVDIIRPGTQLDERGNRTGADDTTIAEKVPASILETRGAEPIDGQQQYATKSIEVRLIAARTWALAENDWLIFRATGRKLEIVEIRDPENISREVRLMCGEIKG